MFTSIRPMFVGKTGCILFIALCGFLIRVESAAADRLLTERLAGYILGAQQRFGESFQLSVYAAQLGKDQNELIFSHQSDRKMRPASVVKILTSVAALRKLGAQYRFPTEVYVDSPPNERNTTLNPTAGLEKRASAAEWRAGNLYIRGYGDPTMIDGRLWELVRSIRYHGVETVQDVIVDDTLFLKPPGARGSKPYQAGLSALSLNHNCYALHIAPSSPGMKAHVHLTAGAPYELRNRLETRQGQRLSAIVNQSISSRAFVPEQQLQKSGKYLVLSENEMRVDVKGTIGREAEFETQYYSVPYPPGYFASVLKQFLAKEGIEVDGKVLIGEVPAGAKKLFVYESQPVNEIIKDLNHYSNNFIAGQLQFALGQDSDSGYFSLEKGLERIKDVLRQRGYPDSTFQLYDASGLDKRSQLTAEQLVSVLADAYRDFSIAPDLVSALSRYKHSGTLRERSALSSSGLDAALRSELDDLQRRAAGVWGKTGTLNSVSTLAGYLELENGERAAFAILSSGIDKDSATEIEDVLVELLIGSRAKK